MGIARRRLVKLALQSVAILALPVSKLAAPVVPCIQAVRNRFFSIPVKQLDPDDINKPGRWGG